MLDPESPHALHVDVPIGDRGNAAEMSVGIGSWRGRDDGLHLTRVGVLVISVRKVPLSKLLNLLTCIFDPCLTY